MNWKLFLVYEVLIFILSIAICVINRDAKQTVIDFFVVNLMGWLFLGSLIGFYFLMEWTRT